MKKENKENKEETKESVDENGIKNYDWKKIPINDALIEHETAKAFLIKIPDTNLKFWHPRKLVRTYRGVTSVSYLDDFEIRAFEEGDKDGSTRRVIPIPEFEKMMSKKVDESKLPKYKIVGKERKDGEPYFRIVATRDLKFVNKGMLGGLIASPECLSQEGDCWIMQDVCIDDEDVMIFENALISGGAGIWGGSKIYGNAKISGGEIYNSEVFGESVLNGCNIFKSFIGKNNEKYNFKRIEENIITEDDEGSFGIDERTIREVKESKKAREKAAAKAKKTAKTKENKSNESNE